MWCRYIKFWVFWEICTCRFFLFFTPLKYMGTTVWKKLSSPFAFLKWTRTENYSLDFICNATGVHLWGTPEFLLHCKDKKIFFEFLPFAFEIALEPFISVSLVSSTICFSDPFLLLVGGCVPISVVKRLMTHPVFLKMMIESIYFICLIGEKCRSFISLTPPADRGNYILPLFWASAPLF